MSTDVDVFISNYTLVDPEIYQLWIEGHNSSEAVAILNQRGLGQVTGASLELIASDVLDHYRTYSLLERLLSNPNKLKDQLEFQIEPQTRRLLIEKFYDFDDSVVRELLGKKLSSKHRKDLDDVSEKTNIPLKSCRRQFDNVKRIFKMVEELPGSLTQNIQKLFYLPEALARRYACSVFLGCMRLETSKRRLQYLTFDHLRRCTESIIAHWTYPNAGAEYYDTELDKEFLLDLREMRVMFDREREHKHLVCTQLKPTLLAKSYSELEANFRNYSRPILTLATALHRGREQRNLFLDLAQILDVLRTNGWAATELEMFLKAYAQCATELDIFRDPDLKSAWERFMAVVSACLLIMYG